MIVKVEFYEKCTYIIDNQDHNRLSNENVGSHRLGMSQILKIFDIIRD